MIDHGPPSAPLRNPNALVHQIKNITLSQRRIGLSNKVVVELEFSGLMLLLKTLAY